MPKTVIPRGEPGEAWTNTTGKILFQWVCNFSNSCGRCIEQANTVGSWHPLPAHRGCSCRNVPVPPGYEAAPWIDYQAEVRALDPDQQRRVIGAANWRLVESGAVRWDDVVQRTRIRPLKEVVARHGLSVRDLTSAGVPRHQATSTWAAVHTPERLAAAASREDLVRRLRSGGLTAEEVRREVAGRLAERVGIGGGPSGPTRLRVVVPPPPPEPVEAEPLDFGEDQRAAGKFLRENWGKWAKGLTEAEREAIEYYKYNGPNISAELAGRPIYTTEDPARRAKVRADRLKAADGLDSALARSTVPDEVIVYRGTYLSRFGVKHATELEGKVVSESGAGYLSTSLSRKLVDETYTGDVLFHIRAPKGTHAIAPDIPMKTLGTDDAEWELVFGRNTKVKVIWVESKLDNDLNTVWVAHAEVIPRPPQPKSPRTPRLKAPKRTPGPKTESPGGTPKQPTAEAKAVDPRAAELAGLRAEAEAARAEYDRHKAAGSTFSPERFAARDRWREASRRLADYEAGIVPREPPSPPKPKSEPTPIPTPTGPTWVKASPPGPEPIPPTAAKSATEADRALQAAVAGARKLSEQVRAAKDWVAANRANAPRPARKHWMPAAEPMDRVAFGGITWHFPDTPEGHNALAFTLRNMAEAGKLPDRLLKATTDVYFSSATVQHPLIPGMESPGSGGEDRAIVTYKNRSLDLEFFAHEAGHNLAAELYGSIYPTARSEFKAATATGEGPPSDYGALNTSEDFAESVKYYTVNPSKFRESHPERAKVLDRILGDPTHGG